MTVFIMVKRLFFPWLFVSAAVSFSYSAGIMFQKERVDAVIRAPDMLEIRGTYWFVNKDTLPSSAALFYPFPIDSFSAYPHYLSVARLPDKKPLRFDTFSNGIRWPITLAVKGCDSIRVVYRQRVKRMQGRYIITTAKVWGRALSSAEFSVTVPPGMVLDYWSFIADTTFLRNDTLVYRYRRAPFSPEADMLLRWRNK